MWVMLFFGNGLLMVLYSNEWFLRKVCHQVRPKAPAPSKSPFPTTPTPPHSHKAICAENESGYCNPFLEFMPFTFKVDWRWE